jgi:hypothetical protein
MYRTGVRNTWIGGLAVCAAAAAAAPPLAGAATYQAPRQSAAVAFGTRTPHAASALTVAIDYFNPDDRRAKPYAVQEVVIRLQKGTRIDTSVPARCTASDQELTSAGTAACPPGSRVGGGTIDLDDGLMTGPFPRIIKNRVDILNNRRELILLTETTNTPGPPVRAVAREPITNGDTLTAEAPPLPGQPPPDSYTAIKRVRTNLKRVVRGRRAFLTTPPRCGRTRTWTNRTDFAYRDGVEQSVVNRIRCKSRVSRGDD